MHCGYGDDVDMPDHERTRIAMLCCEGRGHEYHKRRCALAWKHRTVVSTAMPFSMQGMVMKSARRDSISIRPGRFVATQMNSSALVPNRCAFRSSTYSVRF